MHLLIVEDDDTIAKYVEKGLSEAGHSCELCSDGRDGLTLAVQGNFDVVIADRMLPGLDGLSMVKAMRQARCLVPVVFVTSVGGLGDRVEGLDAGGDDYVVKPFAFIELMARINAIARRPNINSEQLVLKVADLEVDILKRRVTRASVVIDLKPREFAILEMLVRAEGRVITRTMLLERIWEFNFDPQTSVVETQISRLRAKIDKPFDVPLIHTVRNTGYRLNAPS
ncbi:MAG: response regulator transcription factor [Pseudomonadota bacterium]